MDTSALEQLIRLFHPDFQAVVLFGSLETDYETPDSDVDLAILLPPRSAKVADSQALTECRDRLSSHFGRPVDLINLRRVPTAFQYEILRTGRIIIGGESEAFRLFEMLTLSLHQKLEEERAPILAQIVLDGRILAV